MKPTSMFPLAATFFVLIEKVVPRGEMIARIAGVACLLAAAWIVVKTTAAT